MPRSSKHRTLRATLACVLVAPLFAVQASDDAYTPAYHTCLDDAGGVTAGMIDCIATELAVQDNRLNKTYRELGATLAPARKDELKQVQRDWLRFRDGNCAFYADPDGGTLARVSANECVLRMTTQRADELHNLLPME